MAEPKRFTVLFPDWHLGAFYSANTTYKREKFYHQADGSTDTGNSAMKLEFANACTQLGWNKDDLNAIQYVDGQGEVEYSNGHNNTTFSGNTSISNFIVLLDKWDKQVRIDVAEDERVAAIPTWDAIRADRDEKIKVSDGIFNYATETGQSVPQEWKNYRQALRDIPQTYGADSGNTELVVWPTAPAWPNWGAGNTA
jgi:hypothetical protein